jgi:hypothetical protein
MFSLQFRAIFYRHWAIFRRTRLVFVRILAPYVIFLALGIVIIVALSAGDDLNPEPTTFKTFHLRDNPSYAIVYASSGDPQTDTVVTDLSKALQQTIKSDTGVEPFEWRFVTINDFQAWVYRQQEQNSSQVNLV